MAVDAKKSLTLIVKSPAGILYEKVGLRSVQLDLSDGKIGIRSRHAPMIAEMIDGDAMLDDGKSIERLPLRSGIVSIQEDVITIYTHSLDGSDAAFETTDGQFDDVYESIISTLIPGSHAAEGQNGT